MFPILIHSSNSVNFAMTNDLPFEPLTAFDKVTDCRLSEG